MANSKSTFKDIVKKAAEAAANAARNTTQMQRGQQSQTPAIQTVQPQRNSTFAALVETAAKAREAVLNNPDVMLRALQTSADISSDITDNLNKPRNVEQKKITDFSTEQEYLDYLRITVPENEAGNAVSTALKDAKSQYTEGTRASSPDLSPRMARELAQAGRQDLISERIDNQGGGQNQFYDATMMERMNQWLPEEKQYTPQAISAARAGGSAVSRVRREFDNLYRQQIGVEDRVRRDKVIAEYESVRNNPDYAAVSSAGRQYIDADFAAYVGEKVHESRFMNRSAAYIYRTLSKEFEEVVGNPVQWAADHAQELLQPDENGIFMQDENMRTQGLYNPLYLYMSDEQVATYSYYLAAGGKEKAEEYFKAIEQDLRTLRASNQDMTYKQWAETHPGLAFVARGINQVGTVTAIPETLRQTAANSKLFGDGIDRPLDISTDAFSASRRSSGLSEGILNSTDNEVAKFLINVGFSLEDNAIATGMGFLFGPEAAAILLSAESTAASMYEAGEQGLSAADATKVGIINGGWEYLTEKMAFEQLFDFVKNSPNINARRVQAFMKQAGVEATEEYANSILSTMTERIALGGDSSYDRYVFELQQNEGMTYEEAVKAADVQFYWLQPLQSAAAGFLSGGGSTIAINAVNNVTNKLRGSAPQNVQQERVAETEAAAAVGMTAVEQNAANTLAGIAQRAQTGENTIADIVAEKVLTGEKVGNAELRQLQAAPAPVRRAFTDMTDIDIAGMDSSRMRAAIAAASKNATVTKEKAAQYFSVLGQEMQRTAENPATPVQSAPAAQYDALNYNAPDASAVGAIDATREGGRPLEVASAPDMGAASDMAIDFRRQHTSPTTSAQDKWQAIRSRGNTIKAVTPSEVREIADLYNEAAYHFDFELENKIRTELRENGYADLADALFSGEVDKIITDRGKDSSGQKLSEQQIEFFKDSAVRTKNGRGKLIPMYHGTPERFTVFDRNKSVHASLGYGMYFTNSLKTAKEYQDKNGSQDGGTIHKVYLNIKNPCYAEERIDKDRWRKVFDKLGLDASWLQDVYENAPNYSAAYRVFGMVESPKVTPDEWTEAMKSVGWDGWISDGRYEYMAVAFDPEQIKRTDNRNPTGSGDIRFSARRNPVSQRDTDYLAAVESGDMDTAQKMVDEAAKAAGYTIKAYHGTARADRVGNEFLPERATSGPMAFFTSDPEIASHYARDKRDTSLAYDEEYDDFYSQFRVNRNGKSIKVQDLWKSMTFAEKQRIKDAGSHITWNEDMDEIVWNDNVSHGLGNWDAYTLNMHNGNAIEALIDCWLESGELYGNEGDFIKVLRLAGIEGVEYRDPDARHEKVYNTFLRIRKPFSTDNVDAAFISAFEKWYSEQDVSAYERESSYADMWDKNSVSAEQFAERLRDDIANKTTHAWTSIPDSMTDYLKSLGYDGIQDRGGKYTGNTHTVWVPFSSNQIKSSDPVVYDDNSKVVPLSKRFDDSQNDIRFSARKPTTDISTAISRIESGEFSVAQMRNIASQIGYKLTGKTKKAMVEELAGAVDMAAGMDDGLTLDLPQAVVPTVPKVATTARTAKPASKLTRHEKAFAAAREKVSARAGRSMIGQRTITTKDGTQISFVEVDPMSFAYGDDSLQAEIQAADKVAASFGFKPIYAAGDALVLNGEDMGSDWSGFTADDNIVLNIEDLRGAIEWAARHEVGHEVLGGQTAEQRHRTLQDYYTLRRAWAERNGTTEQLEARINDIITTQVYNKNDPDAVYEELLCNDIADAWNDRSFAEYAMAENLNLWQRLARAVGRVLQKLRAVFKGDYSSYAEMQQLHSFMLEIINEYRPTRQAQVQANASLGDRLTGFTPIVKQGELPADIHRTAQHAKLLADKNAGRYQGRQYREVSLSRWTTPTGVSDAALANVTTRRPQETAKYGYKKVFDGGEQVTIYVTNPDSARLSAQQKNNVKALRSLASATGMRIGFGTGNKIHANKKTGESARRWDVITSNGTTYINLDAADPYTALLGQQWYDRYAAANPARARKLNRLLARANRITGETTSAREFASQQLTSSAISNYGSGSRTAMSATALQMKPSELLETIAGSRSLLRSVAKEHPTLISHAASVVGDLIAKHRGKTDQRVQRILAQAEANLNYALAQTADENRNVDPGGKINANKRKSAPEGVRFMSIKRTQNMTLSEQLRLLEKKQLQSSDALYFGQTPKSLDEIGLDRLPLAFTVSEYMKSRKEKHNVPRRCMKQLLASLSDPILSFSIGNEHGVLTKDIDGDGKPLLVALHGSISMDRQPVNRIKSVYGIDNMSAWISNQLGGGKRLHLFDKKRATEILQTNGYKAEVGENGHSYAESIPHPTDKVKFSARRDNNTALREPTRPERRTWLDDYADTYGQIPEGENVNSRGDQRIPRRIDKETKTRQTYRTYAEALTTPDDFVGELEKEVVDGRASYTPLSNKAAAGYADSKIAEGMDEAMATWNAVTHGDVIADKNQIALGERLIMEAINNRDVKLFTKLVSEVAAEATRAGQMVQAISMVKRLSPEGQLMSFQKEVSKLNESLANRKGHPQITPDESLTQEYMDIASELEGVRKEISELEGTPENRRTERQQDAIDSLEAREKQLEQQLRDKKNEMITDAAEQIPPTWMDKLRAWRYLAMLGNPRTHIRNLMGNAMFIPAVRIKQGIAGGIERLAGIKPGERTQGIAASKELRDFAREDAKTQLDILAAGGKYNQTDAIAAEQKPFDDSKVIGKTLNKLAEINSEALEGVDASFLRKHYGFALSRYAAANKWTVEYLKRSPEALAKARGFAYREAQRATYRDLSSFAQLMSKVSNKLSKQRGLGKLGYMMFEGAMPFKKTPCNIMKRGIEYSPLGIASAISKGAIMLRDRRNGVESDYSGTEFINDLAAGMTGTMIMGLGYLMTSLGMLHGRDKDEEDEINAIQGVQEYSVIVGGHSYTVDWVTPVAFPLFVGSELYDQISADRDGYSMDDFYNSLSGIAEPLFSLSMMDGIQSMMQSYSSEGAVFEAGVSAAESYLGQYFPTLSGQVARTITPEVHSSSYRDKTDTMPDFASGVVQKAMAKIPGAYSELPEMIDVWGRNVGAGDTWYQRAVENFLSPGYLERIETTDADRLVSDLYQETGDPAVIPGAASKYFTLDGERYDMSPDEYVAYAKTRGKTSYGILSEFYGSEVFKHLTPEQRVSCVETAYKFATAIAKAQTNSGYVIDTKWQREAYDAFLAGETTLAQAIIDYKTK